MNAAPSALELQHECPNRDTWVAFNTGRLSDPEMEVLAEHVGACKTCELTLQELLRQPADSFEAKLLRFCAELSSQVRNTLSGFDAKLRENSPTRSHNGRGARVAPASGQVLTFEAQSLGPYQLLEIIGRGGMGVVYRATHVVLNRTIALKTLHPGWERCGEAFVRFRREGEVIARLVHPNIVRIYDFNEHEGVPYLSMELVEGEHLARKLSRGTLAFRDAAELVRALALAVGYAHTRKVVHRDLKPLNVLIAHDGTPKVTDFGLAKVLDEEWEKLTHTDAVMGTPSYMAPEQANGRAADIGPHTDIYALGAILYESLTGTPPYLSDTKLKTLNLVQEGNLISPTRYRPDIPAELEAICMKCLAHAPGNRYPSAQALADELGRWLVGKPIQTPRPSRWRRVPISRRRAAVVLGGALIAAGLMGATAAFMSGPSRTPGPDGESASVRRELEAELDAGRPVTLVDETGYPKWFRWRAGKGSQRTHIEPDGTFSAEMLERLNPGLLELLPDTRTDRYKLTAQIRHDLGEFGELVGLYVAHRTYPRDPREIQFFADVQFGSVTPAQGVIMDTKRKQITQEKQSHHMALALQLYTERTSSPNPSITWNEINGGRLPTHGPRNGIWHDLEVIVTPDTIIATVDGHRMEMPTAKLSGDSLQSGAKDLRRLRSGDPAFEKLRLEYAPRGGLGLSLAPRSAASIRRVTVTPLPTDQ